MSLDNLLRELLSKLGFFTRASSDVISNIRAQILEAITMMDVSLVLSEKKRKILRNFHSYKYCQVFIITAKATYNDWMIIKSMTLQAHDHPSPWILFYLYTWLLVSFIT